MKQLLKLIVLNLVFLLVFELGRIYFILYNASYYKQGLLSVFFETAANGFRLDLSAAAYCMVPFVLLGILGPLMKASWQYHISIGVFIAELLLILLITVADPELYRQWGSKFNNQVLVYITHPKEMALSSGSADFVRTILFLFVLLPVLYLIYRLALLVFKQNAEGKTAPVLLSILFAGFSFLMLRGGTGVATISQSSAIFTSDRSINAAAINSTWNALYYLVNDSKSLYGTGFSAADQKTAEASFAEQTKPDSAELKLTNLEKPNIIIVMLESFTAGASRYFYGENNCTPALDRLAGENLSFTNCYSSGDRTEKGLLSINSGYPAQPLSSLIIFPDKVAKLPGLSKDLKKLGYHSFFLYGGDVDFASMKSYLHMQEFDFLADKNQFSPEDMNSKWGAHDGKLYDKSLELMDAEKEPFYSLILTLSSHEPFDVPHSSPDLPKDAWYPYKNSLRYADKCLEQFIAACSTRSWYKNTLIVLVADHGHDIGLKDVNYFGPEKFHIPLLVTGGALRPELKGLQIKSPVSQTIVAPLLLSSLGQNTAAYRWQSGIFAKGAFAQYHFNNGFGRVTENAWAIYDNAGSGMFYKGPPEDSAAIKNSGLMFQQVLVSDFLSK